MSNIAEWPVRSQGSSGRRRWAVVSFVVAAIAQVALPLVPSAAVLLVTLTVFFLAVASCLTAMSTWKPAGVMRAGASVLVVAFLIELLGSKTGFPFGEYSYGRRLVPHLGGVPLIVPLAWLAMALPAWEIGRRTSPRPALQALTGGAALTIWDLFLDPMMIGYGFWTWALSGSQASGWHGVPWTNYLGWMATATLICAIVQRLLPSGPIPPNRGLVALYIWMIGFSALGFILPIAFDRPSIGVIGAAASLPLLVVALRPRPRPWLAS